MGGNDCGVVWDYDVRDYFVRGSVSDEADFFVS